MKGSFVSEMNVCFNDSPKCNFYRYIYESNTLQYYLYNSVNYMYKPIICKYRLCSHSLNIETGRFYNIERSLRFCNACDTQVIEDEFHFILE